MKAANKDLVLAIDCGTQSVRALIFDLQGQLQLKSRVPIEPYFSTAPGLAEQDPQVFWQTLCQSCQQLWTLLDSSPEDLSRDRLAGVALTTQRSTMINLDQNGQPLRPAIVWLDQRRTSGLKPVGGLWPGFWPYPACRRTVAYLQAEAEANWLSRTSPKSGRKPINTCSYLAT
jgi:sugar (pentulose or hexulose) kinase